MDLPIVDIALNSLVEYIDLRIVLFDREWRIRRVSAAAKESGKHDLHW